MVHTAKEWGMTPSEFFDLSDLDKSYMMAHDSAIATMEDWESYLSERKSSRGTNIQDLFV